MYDDSEDQPEPNVARQIDENLKRVYQDIVGDEVPDRFKALLDQLKMQDGAPADNADAAPASGASARGSAP